MLETFSMSIRSLTAERTTRVYLPQNYQDSEESYPVLYMHDGKNVFKDEDAGGGVSLGVEAYLDELGIGIIVVGIDANPSSEGRVNEFCPWLNGDYSTRIIGHKQDTGGQGVLYTDFLVHELKPHIDENYRTLSERSYMAGISLGGLISTFSACRYPGVFQRIAGVSSGFYRNQEEIENMLRQSDLSSIERFYLDCGTDEGKDDAKASQEFLHSNQMVYDILKDKVAHAEFQVIGGAQHNYTEFRKRMPQVIQFLLS